MEKAVEILFTDRALHEAAGLYGLGTEQFIKRGDFENYVFEAYRDGVPAILRLTHSSHRTEVEVRAELNWIDYLTKHGLAIPGCRVSVNGKLAEVIHVGESYFTVSAFDKAGGHPPDCNNPDVWNDSLFYEWGRVTGHMHRLTSGYRVAPGQPERPNWDEDEIYENAVHYVKPDDGIVLERLAEVLSHLRKLPCGSDSFGMIHTDIHLGNFFVDQGRIMVFDFDDCSYMWYVHDIAIPLYYSLSRMKEAEREAFTQRFLPIFMDGYRSEYQLAASWLKELPYFLKLRDIVLYLVLHKKVAPADRDERLLGWMAEMRERIVRNEAIVETDGIGVH